MPDKETNERRGIQRAGRDLREQLARGGKQITQEQAERRVADACRRVRRDK